MAKIISLLNQKVVLAKTTASTNIASQLHKQGYKVLLVDIDPQGSAFPIGQQLNQKMKKHSR